MTPQKVHFIDTVDSLDKWVEQILDSDYKQIGADIEANSMYRYHQNICLLQISLPEDVLLVDLQTLPLTDSLRNLLSSSNIVKIFQDMKYDLSMFWYEYQCKVQPVFDISIADTLIRSESEYRSQPKLIDEYLGKTHNFAKSVQKSNWGIRPLSAKQLEYAASDVKYLIELHDALKSRLKELDLWEYFDVYMQNIEPIEIRRNFNPKSMWKLKGVQELNQEELNRLHNLVTFRNEIAMKTDRPIHWIIDNRSLVGLVKSTVHKKMDLFQFVQRQQRSVAFIHNYADDILRILNDSLQNPLEMTLPPLGESLRVWIPINETSDQKFKTNISRAKLIKAWSKIVAEKYHILPEMVLQKEEIGYCSSLSDDELLDNLSLPGIPDSRKSEFLEDLVNFLHTS